MFNRIPDKFFISLFILMNTVGAFGYYLGAEFYVRPSSDALLLIVSSCAAVLLAWLCFVLVPKKRVNEFSLDSSISRYDLSSLLAAISFLFVFLYFLKFKDFFVLPQLLSGKVVGESARPDVVGNIPLYWTFTVVLSSLCIPFAISGVVRRFSENAKLRSSIWLLVLLFFSTMLGDKSTLLSVAFFIFFVVGRPSAFKILFFAVLFFLFYGLVKYLYYSESRDIAYFFEMDRLIESIFRRVSFINVSSMGVYLDSLLIPGMELPEGYNNIKQFVFHKIYGYLPGGAPVPYIVSSFGAINYLFIPVVVFCVSFFIFNIRHAFQRAANSSVYYAILYLNFYGAIVLVSGSLFDYFFRSFLPILMILVASRLVILRRVHGGFYDLKASNV